jgi:DNA-directed RNA polymerase subunit RPC12/RpoP
MSKKKDEKGVEIICPHCGYKWVYRGKRWHTLCPNCMQLVETPNKPKEV